MNMRIVAIIASLSLISLSTFSMEVIPRESEENRKQRKELYKMYNEMLKIPIEQRKEMVPRGDSSLFTNKDADNINEILEDYQKKLQSKIDNNENPLRAKWKNMTKAVVVTGITFCTAHYYLQNKQAVGNMIGDNVIFGCANQAAQHYHEAPYRPFVRVVFDTSLFFLPWGNFISA